MSKRFSGIVAVIILSCISVLSYSQDGADNAFSPYSIFGIGDLSPEGSARERSMGGVGIAGRDRRYINMTNPAAVTARDTLSVMFDIGLVNDNRIFRQNGIKSANNTFNINNIAISFPIWKKTAAMVGLKPFSSVGYKYSYNVDDPELLATSGFVTYESDGNGGLYQLFGSVGTTLWNRLSIGAEAIYYFGNIDKETTMRFSQSSFRTISSGYTLQLNSFGAKFGVQYEKPVDDKYLTFAATYRTGSRLNGHVTDYKYASLSSTVDTVYHNIDTLSKTRSVSLKSEIGLGISIRKPEKWSAELNYVFSDWSSSGMDVATGFANNGSSVFSATRTQSVRAGFEYIPNRNDIRYYLRQCAYRGGVYYRQDYYKLDGNAVDSYGITLGITLPIFRWYNGLSIGVDVGQRGGLKGNMVKENYATVVIGFNIHDLWFLKPRYE